MSQSQQRFEILDDLRGVAILLVFTFHSFGAGYNLYSLPWNGWLRSFAVDRSYLALMPFAFGVTGVALFFVVSGFCIQLSFQKMRQAGIGAFFVRRFFRIYPPYLLTMLFFLFAFPWSHWIKPVREAGEGLMQLGFHLPLLHNLTARTYYSINPSFWSIAVEAQLYLLFPFLLLLVSRLGWTKTLWVVGLIEGSIRLGAAVTSMIPGREMPTWLIQSPFCFWFSWSIGARLADDVLEGRPLFLRRSPFLFWVGLTVLAYFIRPLYEFYFTFGAVASGTALARLLGKPRLVNSPSFVTKHLREAGVASYSLYLLHQPFVATVPALIRGVLHHFIHPALLFACCLLSYWPILWLSKLFFRFVELPSIDAGKALAANLTGRLAGRGVRARLGRESRVSSSL